MKEYMNSPKMLDIREGKDIIKLTDLNYAKVARRMERSGSTIAKYIKLDGTPKNVKHTFKEVVREG